MQSSVCFICQVFDVEENGLSGDGIAIVLEFDLYKGTV